MYFSFVSGSNPAFDNKNAIHLVLFICYTVHVNELLDTLAEKLKRYFVLFFQPTAV